MDQAAGAVPGAMPAPHVPSPPALTPIEAARLAAEQRAAAPPALVHSTSADAHKHDLDFNPSAKEKLPFFRTLDSDVSRLKNC